MEPDDDTPRLPDEHSPRRAGTSSGAGRLVAIVVTHNRLDQLRITLQRLLESPRALLEAVVVVDNASTDGTEGWLNETLDDPRIVVHRSLSNTGGAGGFETGMRLAQGRFDPDWMLLMDDDGRPFDGALATFHGRDRSQAEGWAAAVYHPDGRICDINRPSINPFWRWRAFWHTVTGRGRDGFHLGRNDYESLLPREIDGTSFVGFFVSRAGVRRAGFPDGSLFIYGDDVLYTLGLSRNGGRILFDPLIRFEHDYRSTEGGRTRFRPLWKTYYHYRNLLMVYRLCSGPLFVAVFPVVALKWLLKAGQHSGERRVFLRLLAHAIRDGLFRRTDVRHETVLSWAGEPR